jgi:hypothetical protein
MRIVVESSAGRGPAGEEGAKIPGRRGVAGEKDEKASAAGPGQLGSMDVRADALERSASAATCFGRIPTHSERFAACSWVVLSAIITTQESHFRPAPADSGSVTFRNLLQHSGDLLRRSAAA